MATCARRDCVDTVAREVRWEQPMPPPDGPMQVLGVELCERHASELEAKLCQRDGCLRYAELVVGLDGHDYDTGAPRLDELRVCEPCWEAMQEATSVTINGVRMVHDGFGRMKALPPNIGRG